MDKNKVIDIICFILAPTILGGVLLDRYINDSPAGFATFAIALIMFGIVRGKWRKEDKDKQL